MRFAFYLQLLMKSGIGDKAELKSHDLDCVAHVPELGKNLQVRKPTRSNRQAACAASARVITISGG